MCKWKHPCGDDIQGMKAIKSRQTERKKERGTLRESLQGQHS